MNEQKNEQFNYTYAAPTDKERREIQAVREQYLPHPEHGEDAFTRLKRLDKKVQNTPMAFSITLGIIGALIFGLGLSLVLEFNMRLLGVVIAIVGLIPLALAYPVHNFILKKCKAKYGAEILELSAKLLGENDDE